MRADRPSGFCSTFAGGGVAPAAKGLLTQAMLGCIYRHFKLCRFSCAPSLPQQAANGSFEQPYSQEPAAEAAPPAESPAVPDEAAAAPEVLPPPPLPGAAIPKPPPGALPPPPSVWAPPGAAVLATTLQIYACRACCLGLPLHAAPASCPPAHPDGVATPPTCALQACSRSSCRPRLGRQAPQSRLSMLCHVHQKQARTTASCPRRRLRSRRMRVARPLCLVQSSCPPASHSPPGRQRAGSQTVVRRQQAMWRQPLLRPQMSRRRYRRLP